MQKKFLKNLALLVFLNLLVKPFWILGVDREVQNVVGTSEYGFYFTIFNFSFLFFIFLDLGITNFNNRNIAQNNQLLNKHLAGIGTVKLLLGVLYAVVILVAGWMWGFRDRQLYLLAWVGFNQFLLSFILYLRSNISGLLLFKTDSFLSVLDRLLMIGIVSMLLWSGLFHGRFTIEWFVYSQTIAYAATALIALAAILNKSGKLRLNWNTPFFLMILKKSLPFALLVLVMSFYNRIDPVLIERLLPEGVGDHQAGVYAQAFRLLDAGQNFAFLFAVLLLPLFSRMLKDKQPVGQLVRISFSIIISGALIVAFTAVFYGKQIMELMYTPNVGENIAAYHLRIHQSARIFQLLMFSFVAISSNYIFGTLLTANNSLKVLNLIAFTGLIISVVLNLTLVPGMQALGSAYASLATQGVTALLQFFVAHRLLHLNIKYKLVLRFLILTVLLLLTGYSLSWLQLDNWHLSLLLMLFAGIMFTVTLGLLNIKELIGILKAKD
ncbi:MAG: oligosaccharide flippase family protein [Bacteroidales bacterium]|nr:oligosaccharide flippase family protein [Bacteroidales bacterium]